MNRAQNRQRKFSVRNSLKVVGSKNKKVKEEEKKVEKIESIEEEACDEYIEDDDMDELD